MFSLPFLLVAVSLPAHASGGRVGTGGGDSSCMKPEELKKNEAAYVEAGRLTHAPKLSKVDPFTVSAAPTKGCKIPTGEVETSVVSHNSPELQAILDNENKCPAGMVRPSNKAKNREYEKRMAPADGCKSIEIWSFYRSLENQKSFHEAPKDCDRAGKGRVIFKGQQKGNNYSGYYCSRIPFFLNLAAANTAGAEAPYAYAKGASIVIENGSIFNSTSTTRYPQVAKSGKVVGVEEYNSTAGTEVGKYNPWFAEPLPKSKAPAQGGGEEPELPTAPNPNAPAL